MIKKRSQAGFTITELALSVTVASILVIVLFTCTFYYYANTSQSESGTEIALESQTILMQITEDIRLADAISATNAISDANAPGGTWSTNDSTNVIVIESPAVNSSRDIIYDTDTGNPYRNEYVYFVNGKNMFKRVLANPSAVGNTAITTCPAASASSSCPADRLFSSNVSNISFTFYDDLNTTTTDPALARSITLNVDMAKIVFGKNITLGNSTRITFRNI